MKTRFIFPALAITLLTLSRFKCIEECESYIDTPSHFTDTGLSTVPLDNRKEMPVVLGPDAQGYLQAYGFRLSMLTELDDSLGGYNECAKYYLDPRIAAIHVFTRKPIPGVSDPDVSGSFRYVHTIDRVPTYLTMPETASQIMLDWEDGVPNRYDFLLVEPPATEGWYQFELRMTMQDSSIVSTVTDSIYLK